MSNAISRARSFLFVPASRPERFMKALESGADCVILDLEDAVPPEQKAKARQSMADTLETFTREQLARTVVRINAVDSAWHEEDIRLLAQWTASGLAGVMVPKAESPAQLQATVQALGPAACVIPLIESLAGLDAIDLLACVPQVAQLAFGHLDFQLDLGMRCGTEEAELAAVRFSFVAASRRARLPAPVDGVTVDTANPARLKADALRAKAFGFGGKLCIHPSQVAAIAEIFSPSAEELDWARTVIAEAAKHEGRAFTLGGRMVDLPVVRMAEWTVLQIPATQNVNIATPEVPQ